MFIYLIEILTKTSWNQICWDKVKAEKWIRADKMRESRHANVKMQGLVPGVFEFSSLLRGKKFIPRMRSVTITPNVVIWAKNECPSSRRSPVTFSALRGLGLFTFSAQSRHSHNTLLWIDITWTGNYSSWTPTRSQDLSSEGWDG